MGFPVPRHQINQGFTLVELLISSAVSAIGLGSIAVLAVHQIRIADTVYASATIDRQFRRLSDLLKIEVENKFF
jgi:prepilin-type N-terminal cleavage/methylation domain-containing protein